FVPPHIASDLALGYALVIEVLRQVTGEVQYTGATFQGIPVVDPVLRSVGTDQPQLSAVLLDSPLPVDIHFGRALGNDRAARLAGPFNREHIAPTTQPAELVHLVGVVPAGVDSRCPDRQLDAAGMQVPPLQLLIQRLPGTLI